MGAFAMGCALGYSAPAGEELLSNSTSNSVHLDSDSESAWFSSIVTLGALAGGPVGGLSIKVLGRRGSLLLYPFIFIAGWAIIGKFNKLKKVTNLQIVLRMHISQIIFYDKFEKKHKWSTFLNF